jgi:hypothetical protein
MTEIVSLGLPVAWIGSVVYEWRYVCAGRKKQAPAILTIAGACGGLMLCYRAIVICWAKADYFGSFQACIPLRTLKTVSASVRITAPVESWVKTLTSLPALRAPVWIEGVVANP